MTDASIVIEFLNKLIWHDSVLKDVLFVRANSLDQVKLTINLLTDYQYQQSQLVQITFKKCIKVKADMNWGVHCMSEGEMIYSGRATQDKEEIEKYLDSWNKKEIDSYVEFTLDLASTGSSIYLIFKEIDFRKLEPVSHHNAPLPLPTKKD
jgi:hypothetical protein